MVLCCEATLQAHALLRSQQLCLSACAWLQDDLSYLRAAKFESRRLLADLSMTHEPKMALKCLLNYVDHCTWDVLGGCLEYWVNDSNLQALGHTLEQEVCEGSSHELQEQSTCN